MPSNAISLGEAALQHARRGCRVLPLYHPTPEGHCSCGKSDCPDTGKHPRITRWRERATTDEAIIRGWWKKWPDANIGIATGEGSGFWALDVDGDEGTETLAELECRYGRLPDTVEQITGSCGRHLFFQHVPGLKNAVGFAPGLDVRTEGGFIVAPPSLHKSGRRYAWEVSSHPDDLPLADAPQWLIDRIQAPNRKDNGSPAPVDGHIPEGRRNATLSSRAGSMRRCGMSREAIEAALLRENAARCDPPLQEDEVRKIAASVSRYPAGTAPSDDGMGSPSDSEPGGSRNRKSPPLWEQWVTVLKQQEAELIWPDTLQAYFRLPSGELVAVHSDEGARFFQRHTARDVHYGSERWKRAAGGLRSWIEEHGTVATVFQQAFVDFTRQTAYIGCEDGRTHYRIRPERIDPVPNGTDGVLIIGGRAPVLDRVRPTGELARWLDEETWARPVAKLVMEILAPLIALGAQSFSARPIILAVGEKGSGKTTTLQLFGEMLSGNPVVAQAVKADDRENESRLLNEYLMILDNVEGSPRGVDLADFLATASTQQERAIRKMKVEGEQVRKPVRAFVAVTSFSIPVCLKRPDVMDRTPVLVFEKPPAGKVREKTVRALDRQAAWGDILTAVQRVLSSWPDIPKESELRSIELMQFAHALLPTEAAHRLERTLLDLQADTTGRDSPLAAWIEAAPPPYPMTARELCEHWAGVFGEDRPKSPESLGCMLGRKGGAVGHYRIIGPRDETRNVTVWSFERMEWAATLTQEEALALLRSRFARGDD